MAQAAAQESLRIKFLLIGLVFIIVGGTFAALASQATQTDYSIPNTPVFDDTSLMIGYAQKDYTVTAYIDAVGLIRVIIRNLDIGGTLRLEFVSSEVMTFSVPNRFGPGRIQIELTPYLGATAVFNASIQHQAPSYAMLIPGILTALAGAALILTRVYNLRIVTTNPTQTRV